MDSSTSNIPLRNVTLLFLIKNHQLLLAMKKRGFGKGKWNGVGGKQDPDETIEETAVRECQEEIAVTPIIFKQCATIDFFFDGDDTSMNQKVHAFLCTDWSGEPVETEEMAPQWFNLTDIPYENMWEDDQFWLPQVLAGKYVEASFTFDRRGKLVNSDIKDKQ
jgi:8-oxo-dGTP pyrophosphatase MutT (NUDIX family)